MRGKKDNLTGRIFGFYLVLGCGPKGLSYDSRWRCLCKCGKERIVYAHRLRAGVTKSCGCWGRMMSHKVHFKHGVRRYSQFDPVKGYNSWVGAKGRCFNPHNHKFKDYGARGIVMCSGWSSSFTSFLKDMGECPDGLSLDRIDFNKGYTCGHCQDCLRHGWVLNCRWADATTQARNRRKKTSRLTSSPAPVPSNQLIGSEM